MNDTAHTPLEYERQSRRKRRGGLFVTDAELIEILGVPEKEARQTLRHLDAKRGNGFPRKNPLWGDRRYLPAVKEWLARTNGVTMGLGCDRVAPVTQAPQRGQPA